MSKIKTFLLNNKDITIYYWMVYILLSIGNNSVIFTKWNLFSIIIMSLALLIIVVSAVFIVLERKSKKFENEKTIGEWMESDD